MADATDRATAAQRRPAARRRDQGVRHLHGGRRPRPDDPAGLVLRAARPVRLRQDDDAAHGRRARGADGRAGSCSATRTSPRRKPYQRPVNTVFQSYALFPHLDIFENVAFGLRRRGVKDVDEQVDEMLELVELDGTGPAQARPALRRPAAAGRAGPGARQPARGAAARRAARRARPQAAPPDADRAQADPDRGRPHLRARHPRPGGGHDHGRHHRGDERRADRADGRPGRALRERRARRSSRTSSASPTCSRATVTGTAGERHRRSTCTAPACSVAASRAPRAARRRLLARRPPGEGARDRPADDAPPATCNVITGGVVTDVQLHRGQHPVPGRGCRGARSWWSSSRTRDRPRVARTGDQRRARAGAPTTRSASTPTQDAPAPASRRVEDARHEPRPPRRARHRAAAAAAALGRRRGAAAHAVPAAPARACSGWSSSSSCR